MSRSYCMLSIGVAAIFALPARAAIQWKIEDGGNDHFYEIVSPPEGISWHEARDAATAMGGNLVTITSASEDQFIIDNFMEPNRTVSFRVWLGGYDPTGQIAAIPFGQWEWVTGEAFGYENWQQTSTGSGQPTGSEYFIEYTWEPAINNFGWNDVRSIGFRQPYHYIVEYDTDPAVIPEPSTLVAFAGLGCCVGFGFFLRRHRRVL